MTDRYSVDPVGRVLKTEGRVVLEIFSRYREALLGLEGFSHVIVLYWFHRNDTPDQRSILRVHPRRDGRNPLTGVFATRSPVRPNLLGLEVCRIEAITGLEIHVQDMDALDRTPILDLKPYIPASDSVSEATVPPWVGTDKTE